MGACADHWAGCPVHDRDRHQDRRGRRRRRGAELREHHRDAGRNRLDDHQDACWNQAEEETSQEAAE